MLGEGIGDVALKRLDDAERDGDRDLRGDPRHRLLLRRASARASTRRCREGQALALRRAYERAGYGPETVELVEAHGTGTEAGDAAEFEALRSVFEAAQARATAVVRARLGEVADRPHQGGRRRRRPDQGGAGAAPQGAAADDQGRARRTPRSTIETQPVLPQHRGAAVDAATRRTRAARR